MLPLVLGIELKSSGQAALNRKASALQHTPLLKTGLHAIQDIPEVNNRPISASRVRKLSQLASTLFFIHRWEFPQGTEQEAARNPPEGLSDLALQTKNASRALCLGLLPC